MKKKGIMGLCLALLLALLTACGGADPEIGNYGSGGAAAYGETGQQVQEESSSPPESSAHGEEAEQAPSEEALRQTGGRGEESPGEAEAEAPADVRADLPVYGEFYYDLENVDLYLELYQELPPNYITKKEARELGWEGGSVEDCLEGAAIGGDTFGNREGLLPQAPGRTYTECDIDTDGYGSRGSRRLVFSSDGLYFYTSDHYESFREIRVTQDYSLEAAVE